MRVLREGPAEQASNPIGNEDPSCPCIAANPAPGADCDRAGRDRGFGGAWRISMDEELRRVHIKRRAFCSVRYVLTWLMLWARR